MQTTVLYSLGSQKLGTLIDVATYFEGILCCKFFDGRHYCEKFMIFVVTVCVFVDMHHNLMHGHRFLKPLD